MDLLFIFINPNISEMVCLIKFIERKINLFLEPSVYSLRKYYLNLYLLGLDSFSSKGEVWCTWYIRTRTPESERCQYQNHLGFLSGTSILEIN